MNPTSFQILASVCFTLAVLHTFSVKWFQNLANRFPNGSVAENIFHLLGEVEVVFGIWAAVFLISSAVFISPHMATTYLEGLDFTEAAFVFVIMAMASTRPVLHFAERVLLSFSQLLPLNKDVGAYAVMLSIGPLLGSLITEPAAMTLTALLVKERVFDRKLPEKAKYLTLGALFVNISIGGVLTSFAAPPVIMVASTWHWDLAYMISHFGWKAIVAIILNTTLATWYCRQGLKNLKPLPKKEKNKDRSPWWIIALHLGLMISVVKFAHQPKIFGAIFLFFLGLAKVTEEFQETIKIRESLLVGFFLGGLVVLGGLQHWWLEPFIAQVSALPLFLGTTALTAIVDNAALTYLGSQVQGLGETTKFALVAGAVAGGGLTVIANAPNPAGFSILRSSFGRDGISSLSLFLGALLPTLIAMSCLWLL